jgi:hypothetical protein
MHCSSTARLVHIVLFIHRRFSAPCGHHAGDAEAQAAAARRHVKAPLLLHEEEFKAAALEQMAIAVR